MKTALLRLWRGLLVVLAEVLPRLALLLLVAVVWAVTAYVCGRQSGLLWITDERAFMRTLFPGIF